MEYSALMKDPRLQPLSTRDFGNECGRLFQGTRDIPGTDTCLFIGLKNIPNDRKITYGKIVCDHKPHKKEKERVRLTVGGDRLEYSGDVATSTADHNIQNTHQQHPLHQGRRHDDDGHKELLSRQPAATV
jgi:hypothetical protein